MPVSLPVTASSMNYASVVFAGFAAMSIGWYFIRGRKDFTGPPVVQDAEPVLKGQGIHTDSETGLAQEEAMVGSKLR